MNNLNFLTITLIALALVFASCAPVSPADEPVSNTPAPPPTQSESDPDRPVKIAQSNVSRETNPSVAPTDLQTLVSGNNDFALNLSNSLSGQTENIIFSPYSISVALAMTYAGARGQTESQMTDVLRFSLGQSRTHPAFNALDLKLAQNSKSVDPNLTPLQLNIANAVWAQQGYSFQQDFLDTVALNYGAGIRLDDFVGQYEPVRMEINAWVEEQTKDKIKNLLAEGTLNANTRMVLVNAIYFKADWFTPFDPNNTHDATFHLLDGSEKQVRMMSGELALVPYRLGDGYQAVELPYASGTAAMTILVPDEGKFSQFESALNIAMWNDILAGMQPASVQLGLPKFTFESQFGLKDQLSALGMPDAFDLVRADFSGMTGNRDLFISDVVHKAFVAVDEKGTEAAASTAVIMQLRGAPTFKVSLIIDRPFIFIIRDTVTGQILFMGRVVNPAQ